MPNVFALSGTTPEILAVALAKYSRSKESIVEALASLTEARSAEFHEKWVLGYGDASVADMAAVAVAFEGVSMLAAKAVQHSRIASYQEKSSRYVDFAETSPVIPQEIAIVPEAAELFVNTTRFMLNAYTTVLEAMERHYRATRQDRRPEGMTERAADAKIRARALDVARALLPAATPTNFGLVASARTVRRMVSRLKTHPLAEVRDLGHRLEHAATADPGSAPTLVRHTDPATVLFDSDFLIVAWIHHNMTLHPAMKTFVVASDIPPVTFTYAGDLDPVLEVAAGLVYPHVNPWPFALVYAFLAEHVPRDRVSALLESVQRCRGRHDNVLRAWESAPLIFDLRTDFGTYRDLSRHRMCTLLEQPLSVNAGGFTLPVPGVGMVEASDVVQAGVYNVLTDTLRTVHEQYLTLGRLLSAHGHHNITNFDRASTRLFGDDSVSKEAVLEYVRTRGILDQASYILPLCANKCYVMKMNAREFFHLVELRSRPGGHFTYRETAHRMAEAVGRRFPGLVTGLRVTPIDPVGDFFRR